MSVFMIEAVQGGDWIVATPAYDQEAQVCTVTTEQGAEEMVLIQRVEGKNLRFHRSLRGAHVFVFEEQAVGDELVLEQLIAMVPDELRDGAGSETRRAVIGQALATGTERLEAILGDVLERLDRVEHSAATERGAGALGSGGAERYQIDREPQAIPQLRGTVGSSIPVTHGATDATGPFGGAAMGNSAVGSAMPPGMAGLLAQQQEVLVRSWSASN